MGVKNKMECKNRYYYADEAYDEVIYDLEALQQAIKEICDVGTVKRIERRKEEILKNGKKSKRVGRVF